MSRTLFWYIFRDLLRIFFLASGVLAGIMSFGGLLRPLYEFGLDVGQVIQILSYSSPAMSAYSLPIAALFATTIVYGRLSADNEMTACRAAGIAHFSMALPGLVLGGVVAIVSLLLLCFVVPYYTLKVEKVIYSNLAQLAAGQIQRSHQIRFEHGEMPVTIFAQEAQVLPEDPDRPGDQGLRLYGPLIVRFAEADRNRPQVPDEFYMARQADAHISQDHDDDEVTLSADLSGGLKFPRKFGGNTRQNTQISIGTTRFGPVPLPSPVRENTKFMDIFRLRMLLDHPENSRRIRSTLREFIIRDQQQQYLAMLARQLNGAGRRVALGGEGSAEQYVLVRGSLPAEIGKQRLSMGSTDALPGATPARLIQLRNGQSVLDVQAGEIRVRAWPQIEQHRMDLDLEMVNCVVSVPGDPAPSPRENFSRSITLPMPAEIYALAARPASAYVTGNVNPEDQNRLRREMQKLSNSVVSELHARISFAVSCFILVLVGCALGMMFRSGNFLSAFAISVVPALISIALIVTGQHTCENVPYRIDANWVNPLPLGIGLIWSGNAAVLVIGAVLMGRLQRQ